MADGKVSFDDCEALTWSFGWTGLPSRSVARVASTSLVFMFVEVPEPVWNVSMGNSASHSPFTTSSAAETIAFAMSSGTTPSSALTVAADRLIAASAWTRGASTRCPLTGKFSTARWVWARHLAATGTRTSPIESCSVRNSALSVTKPRLADRFTGKTGHQGRWRDQNGTVEYACSLVSWCWLWTRRIVPLRERMTSESVVAPPGR